MYARTQRFRTELGMWSHVVIFTSLVQALFYGHVPQQLAIVMAAIALGLIDRHDPDNVGIVTVRGRGVNDGPLPTLGQTSSRSSGQLSSE